MSKSFQWDPAKDKKNEIKHGIRLQDSKPAFSDPNQITKKVSDAKGPYGEDRFKTTGSVFQKIWNIIWTPRDEDIRLISAHRAGKKDIRKYNNNRK